MLNNLSEIPNLNTEVFGKRLKELRIKRSLTLVELANETQITRQTLSNYELNKTKPAPYNLYILARFFAVPFDYLIGQENVDSSIQRIDEISRYTGLSESAIEVLHFFKSALTQGFDNSSDTRCVFPFISALIEEQTIGHKPHSVMNLESYIEIFYKTSKEIRELELLLPKQEQDYDYFKYKSRYDEYNNITNGLMSNYKELYLQYLSIKFDITHDYNYTTLLEMVELERKKRELAARICNKIPTLEINDLDDLDDLCDNLFFSKDYNLSVERIHQIESDKAKALMDLFDYLDEATKDKPYRFVLNSNKSIYNIQKANN